MDGQITNVRSRGGLGALGVLVAFGALGCDARALPAALPASLVFLPAAADAGARFGAAPRLFSRASGDSRALHVYQPQPGVTPVVLDAALCEAGALQTLFGIGKVERVELLSPEDDATLEAIGYTRWSFPCTPPKPVAVQPTADGKTWLVAVATDPPAPPDAGSAEAPSLVLAIPRRCTSLIDHFRVAEQAQAQRGTAPGPALSPTLALSCGTLTPAESVAGWSADIVLGDDVRPLVRLSRGASEVYLHRVGGVSPSAGSQPENRRVLDHVAALFQVPAERQSASLEYVPMPQVALDVCTGQCASFVPNHLVAKQLGCADDCPAQAARFHLQERLAENGAKVLDLVRENDASFRPVPFAGCSGVGSWAQALGLTVRRDTTDLVSAGQARYLTPGRTAAVPCVRDTGCTVQVAANDDLAAPSLSRAIGNACWRNEDVLTLRLAGNALATGTLTLAAPGLPSSLTTVRVVATKEGSEIRVPGRVCGATPCQNETPALSVRGPLRVEIDGLRFVALPPALPPPDPSRTNPAPQPVLPGNRVALEIKDGATVVLRNAAIGAAGKDGAAVPLPELFYAGVRVTDAKLFAWHASVHAYTTAIEATRAQVVVNSVKTEERVALSALAGPRRYAELLNLSGWPMAQPINFAALRLAGSGTRAFLGGVQLAAPIGIVYVGPGSGKSDLVVVDADIGWNPDCKTPVFSVESRALELAGSGELRFSAVDVKGFGSLFRCVEPASTAAVFEGYSTFKGIRQPTDFGRCKVSTEFDVRPEICEP